MRPYRTWNSLGVDVPSFGKKRERACYLIRAIRFRTSARHGPGRGDRRASKNIRASSLASGRASCASDVCADSSSRSGVRAFPLARAGRPRITRATTHRTTPCDGSQIRSFVFRRARGALGGAADFVRAGRRPRTAKGQPPIFIRSGTGKKQGRTVPHNHRTLRTKTVSRTSQAGVRRIARQAHARRAMKLAAPAPVKQLANVFRHRPFARTHGCAKQTRTGTA